MTVRNSEPPNLARAPRVIYSLIVPLLGLVGFYLILWRLWNPNELRWTGSALDIYVAWVLKGMLGLIFTPFLL
jgi:hypothetical protein